MSKPRRQKFVRGEADPLQLTPRDISFLRDVAEFRFLNTEQLLSLHEGSRRNITERLSLLYHHHYLDRPKVQTEAKLATSHIVYSLGRKGAEILSKDARERGMVLRRIWEIQKTLPLIAHASMISQFRVCLMLALCEHPARPKIERWVQGYELKDALALRGQRPDLVPDAFFTIRDASGALDFFLEADRGSMSHKVMLDKIQKYWKWYREKKYQKVLGIENFRVLTITTSEERAQNLCKTAREADDKKTGSNMFLFLSDTQYSLKKPDALLSPIWTSAKGEKHTLIK